MITVNKQLYLGAMGYNGTNLIVGDYDDNIYMIDRTGNIIKTVTSGYNTYNITCTTDRIYLTPRSKLVCLDMNGSQMFSYTNNNFSNGRGISVDKEGNIYCCGFGSNNIHQLTPDGQFIKLIVTDITRPRENKSVFKDHVFNAGHLIQTKCNPDYAGSEKRKIFETTVPPSGPPPPYKVACLFFVRFCLYNLDIAILNMLFSPNFYVSQLIINS
ncbi:hypothetical protein KUTeg_017320 [Tegillarca granosa]|uniref:SMP-30/Gluconolactonase/LRE-like region domain-containing protein n=1 Tax=Tegillarca granosa TaxID=220873 RepID=A0ABQ9EMM7_TEGGR|nr:hypothetical protein KUTeg_017320 [Tegillarca granosa]